MPYWLTRVAGALDAGRPLDETALLETGLFRSEALAALVLVVMRQTTVYTIAAAHAPRRLRPGKHPLHLRSRESVSAPVPECPGWPVVLLRAPMRAAHRAIPATMSVLQRRDRSCARPSRRPARGWVLSWRVHREHRPAPSPGRSPACR